MKVSKTSKVVLDAILTVMIVAAMFIQITGEFLHEIIGFAFFAALAIHLIFSASWIQNTAKNIGQKKTSRRRGALIAVAILLALSLVVLAISSVAISNILYSAGFVFPLGTYDMWHVVHTASSYSLCVLTVIHLAMHWSFIASVLKLDYNRNRRRAIGAGVYASALLGASALGVAGAAELVPSSVDAKNQVVATTTTTNTQSDNSASSTSPSSSSSSSATSTSRKSKKGDYSRQAAPSESLRVPEPVQEGDSYSQGQDTETDNTMPTGFCTLCRKNCALSAPQCERPYEEGLITQTTTSQR